MSEYAKGVCAGIIIAAIFAAWFYAIGYAFTAQERMDCFKWQRYEQEYPQYETSAETATRCARVGVNVFEYVD